MRDGPRRSRPIAVIARRRRPLGLRSGGAGRPADEKSVARFARTYRGRPRRARSRPRRRGRPRMTALVDPLEMFRLDGKVALVTGGGSGIGRATSAALAGADAAVAILDIDLTRAETAAREITTSGGAASAHQA